MKNNHASWCARELRWIVYGSLFALISTTLSTSSTFALGFTTTCALPITAARANHNDMAQDRSEVSPPGEEFTVSFPATPRLTVGKRFFEDRQSKDKFHFYTVFIDNVLFKVESYEGDKPKDLARITLVFRPGLREGANVQLNGYKGKEFTQNKQGLLVKGRYFVTTRHLYIVEAATRGTDDPAMDQFLNSFRLEQHSSNVPALATLTTVPADEVVKAQDVSTKAMIVSKLPATYTDQARAQGISGNVVLQIVLRATGEVTDIEVQSRRLPGELTEQAIEAAKAIVFLPAIKDGKPISMRTKVEYNFRIY